MNLNKTKKTIVVIAVMAIVFTVSFLIFHIHIEDKSSIELLEKLAWLPWGWSVRYESGLVIIDNLLDASVVAGVYSFVSGQLAYIILLLSEK